MPTYDIPSFQDFVDGESSTVRGKLNSNFDNAEVQIQGVEDRLEESLTALHIDGVIWKRPGDVVDLLVSAGAGLSVNVSAGEALIGYRIQDSGHSNDAGNGITNGAVNYCFLKQDGTLWFNVTGTPPTDQRNILLATVTTAGGVVTAVDNYANGVVRGVGQPSLRSFTCTATEAVRDAVYVSAANTVVQAESDSASPAKARVVGVILAKESATSCIVATDGAIVGGYVGLTSGSAYYLQTVAGTLGTGKPTAPDPIVPVGIAVSTTAILVKIFVDEAALDPGAAFPPHAESHEVGGSDPIDATLDANARVGVRRNTAGSTYARRRLNLIEGSGISIGLSDDAGDEEVDISIASSGTAAHASSHESGGGDALALGNLAGSLTEAQHGALTGAEGDDHTGDLTGNARVGVRKNSGGSVSKRRRLNLIEGANITMTVADDAGDEEVDITINAAGAGGVHAVNHQTGGSDEVYYSQLERSGADPTLHDAYLSPPHISGAEKDGALQRGGDNLVIEGSFEGANSIGTSGHFIWAAQQSGDGVAPVRDNTDSKHGRYCAKFVVAISAGSDFSQLYYQPSVYSTPYLAVSGDDDYAWGWEFWAKSAAGTETLQLMLECYDKDAALLATRIPVNNGVIPAAWTKYNGLFRGEGAGSTQFPAGTVFLRPIFRLTETGGAGTLYLDDVRIYRLPLAEITARKNSAGSVYQRKRINFIEGTNVTLTLADDATDEEIDLTIAATSLPYIRNEIIVVAAGTLTADSAVPKVGYMKCPAAVTIEEVVCEVDTAPTGAALIVDIHKIPVADIETDFTGTTIYTTQGNRPTLAIGDRHVVATAPDVTAIAQGDVLRVYVDQIGSTVAGSDLTVAIRVRQIAAWS